MDLISLAVIFANFLIGSLLRLFTGGFLRLYFTCLEYLESDEYDESYKEESDELWSESG